VASWEARKAAGALAAQPRGDTRQEKRQRSCAEAGGEQCRGVPPPVTACPPLPLPLGCSHWSETPL